MIAMRLEYKTFEEAKKNFKWSERWEVFDKGQEELNIAYECVDRHSKERALIAVARDLGLN